MKLKIFGVLFLLILGVACTQISGDNELLDEQLLEKIMQVNENINSMKFDMTSEIAIQGSDQNMDMSLKATGMIDRAAKKISIIGEAEIKNQDLKMPLETYADGEWIYTKSMDQWIKIKMEEDLFENQDQAKYFADFLKDGEVNFKEVTKDEKEYYFAEIIPDEKVLTSFIKKNNQLPQGNISEIIDSFKNFKLVYYIDKDNYMIDFVDTSYDMSFQNITMSSMQTLNMYDINQPANIVIPDEAKQNAVDFEEFQKNMMALQQAEIVVEGNENIQLTN